MQSNGSANHFAAAANTVGSRAKKLLKVSPVALLVGVAACANSQPPAPRYVQTLLQRGPDGRDQVVGYRDDSVVSGNSVGVYTLRNAEGQPYQVATSGPNVLQTVAPVLYGAGSIMSGAGFILNGVAALRLAGQPQSAGTQINVAGGNGFGVGTGGTATNRTAVDAQGGNAAATANPTLLAAQTANPQLNAALTANPQFSAMLSANPTMVNNVKAWAEANPTWTSNQWTQALQQVQQSTQVQQPSGQPMPPPPHGGSQPPHGGTQGGGWISSDASRPALQGRAHRIAALAITRYTQG